MPNWCMNGVEISHTDPFKIKALSDAMLEGKFCNHVIPCPQELTDTVAGYLGNEDEQKALVEATARNVEKYGHGNWYDFCTAKWGTKWDVSCVNVDVSEDGTTVTAAFDSAWSPPMGIYEMLVELGFEVTAYYYEPGMGYVGKFVDGCDECYDYSGYDSKTVVDLIGEELDEYFDISNSMAEYEAENAEEEAE